MPKERYRAGLRPRRTMAFFQPVDARRPPAARRKGAVRRAATMRWRARTASGSAVTMTRSNGALRAAKCAGTPSRGVEVAAVVVDQHGRHGVTRLPLEEGNGVGAARVGLHRFAGARERRIERASAMWWLLIPAMLGDMERECRHGSKTPEKNSRTKDVEVRMVRVGKATSNTR